MLPLIIGVRLALESGRPVAHVADELGIARETLRKAVRRAEAGGGSRGGLLTSQEREEIRELRKENFELRRANEILQQSPSLDRTRPSAGCKRLSFTPPSGNRESVSAGGSTSPQDQRGRFDGQDHCDDRSNDPTRRSGATGRERLLNTSRQRSQRGAVVERLGWAITDAENTQRAAQALEQMTPVRGGLRQCVGRLGDRVAPASCSRSGHDDRGPAARGPVVEPSS